MCFTPSLISSVAVDLNVSVNVATETSYFDGGIMEKTNSPALVVLAVY